MDQRKVQEIDDIAEFEEWAETSELVAQRNLIVGALEANGAKIGAVEAVSPEDQAMEFFYGKDGNTFNVTLIMRNGERQ
jgi:hypothetical protein